MAIPRRALAARLIALAGLGVLALGGCETARPTLHGPDVLYVATPEQVGVEMLRVAATTPRDVVYDLGSGDGRLVIAAARDFGARGVGVEIDAGLVQDSRDAAARAGVADRTRFLWQDLFASDIREATVVALYLRDDVNLKLRPKLLAELAPGTRVVSHHFGMADWRPDRALSARAPDGEHRVLLWIVPARVGGAWRATIGGRPEALRLVQHFQDVAGTLTLDGETLPLRDGVVDGAALRFGAGGWYFTGRVGDAGLQGDAFAPDGAVVAWSARR